MLQFLVFGGISWHIVEFNVTSWQFCHYFGLLGLLPYLSRIHFCRNLRTFSGKNNFGTKLVGVKIVFFCMSAS